MTDTTAHRILIVDDDEFSLRLLEKILVAEGYAVVKAKDGAEALNLITRDDLDLLITDLTLPRMGGVRLLQEVRKRSSIPAIVVTASEIDSEAQRNSLAAGALKFMVKPLDREELLRAVKDVLGKDRG